MPTIHIDKKSVIIIILALALIASLAYIGLIKFNELEQEKLQSAYDAGTKAGFEYAILGIMKEAVTCKQLPLSYDNKTVSIISVDCLERSSGVQQIPLVNAGLNFSGISSNGRA